MVYYVTHVTFTGCLLPLFKDDSVGGNYTAKQSIHQDISRRDAESGRGTTLVYYLYITTRTSIWSLYYLFKNIAHSYLNIEHFPLYTFMDRTKTHNRDCINIIFPPWLFTL